MNPMLIELPGARKLTRRPRLTRQCPGLFPDSHWETEWSKSKKRNQPMQKGRGGFIQVFYYKNNQVYAAASLGRTLPDFRESGQPPFPTALQGQSASRGASG